MISLSLFSEKGWFIPGRVAKSFFLLLGGRREKSFKTIFNLTNDCQSDSQKMWKEVVGSSVTRELDYSFNICPFAAIKICPTSIFFAKVETKPLYHKSLSITTRLG